MRENLKVVALVEDITVITIVLMEIDKTFTRMEKLVKSEEVNVVNWDETKFS